MDIEKMTVAQLLEYAKSEKQKSARVQADAATFRKSAEELTKAAVAVADISKKNPEL